MTIAQTTDQSLTHQPSARSWPTNVTARILTRSGLHIRDLAATVDITETGSRTVATCQPCGWTTDHGTTYRHQVLEKAQHHADGCTALPNPNA
jgi:hypothetical protein